MNKLYGSIELGFEGKNIDYVLSVGVKPETGEKYMPSLNFVKNKGMLVGEKSVAYWDNENYILESLYKKVLKRYGVKGKKPPHAKYLRHLIEIKGVDTEDFTLLKAMIKKGIELNFFQEYYAKK